MVFMVQLILGIALLTGAVRPLETTTKLTQPKILTNGTDSVKNLIDNEKSESVKYGERISPLKLQKSESYNKTTRRNKGRSYDVDIDKIPDFNNNVYTIPNSNTNSNEEFNFDFTTINTPKFVLTTPKTPYFDQKYREIVDSVERKMDFPKIDNSSEVTNFSLNNLIEEVNKNSNNTKLNYNTYTKTIRNSDKNHDEWEKETATRLNFERKRNDTANEVKINQNDLIKAGTKRLLDDSNNVKKETPLHTTRKSIPLITKTSLRSNTIADAGPIKPDPVNENKENKPYRGSIKYADYQKANETKAIEPSVQENQIIPVRVTPPNNIEKTTIEFHEIATASDINSLPQLTKDYTTAKDINDGLQEQTTVVDLETTEFSEELEMTTIGESTTLENLSTTQSEEKTTLIATLAKMKAIETTMTPEITTEVVTYTTDVALNDATDAVQTTFETIQTFKPNETTPMPVEERTIALTTSIPETTTMEKQTVPPTVAITTQNVVKNTTTIPPDTVKPTDELVTTQINFVHIKNIDANHTTILPDVLKPNEIYKTPEVVDSKPETTSTEDPDSSEISGAGSNGATIAILIACVGGVCLVVLAGLLFIMRKRQKHFNYGQRCRPVSLDDYSVDNVSVFNSVRRKAALRSSKRSYGNPAFEDPVCTTHPLNYQALSKFAQNEDEIKAEFEEIPQIIARTSELPEGCEVKNRYANVIPLPETRVFLSTIDGRQNSDYINANFVTGPKNSRKYYIACQAPMANTVDDFWRMIWEQQSKVILMITHLFECGSEKCVDYLPASEVLDCHRLFGDYQVTLKRREVKEKYVISSLQLKNMVSNSWRDVTHFWYLGWPEKGVPSEANSLIAFLLEARSYMKSATSDRKTITYDKNTEMNPVVVHCSPGTGRTGVVITCDIAIRDFEQTRHVDIPKIVYRIRRDRASAVQTKEQYNFIYKVVNLYATKLSGDVVDARI